MRARGRASRSLSPVRAPRGELLDPAGEAAQRLQRAAQLDVAVAATADRREPLQQLAAGERPQLAAQRLRGGDDQVAQLAEAWLGARDSAVACRHQRPQRFPLAAGAWPGRLRAAPSTTRAARTASSALSCHPSDADDVTRPTSNTCSPSRSASG